MSTSTEFPCASTVAEAAPVADLTGGCQCGAVRYRVTMAPQGVHYCHCRMCQRAVGNLFASLVPVHKERLIWEKEAPTFYRSSSVAERGFCARCGTPLSFAYDVSRWIALTLGSLDHPESVQPGIHFGIESQLPWLRIDDALPRERTDPDADPLRAMQNFQAPPGGAE